MQLIYVQLLSSNEKKVVQRKWNSNVVFTLRHLSPLIANSLFLSEMVSHHIQR